jgi:hypothetical protein
MCGARRCARPCGGNAHLLTCACRSLACTVSSHVSLYVTEPLNGWEFCLAGSARQPPEAPHVIALEGIKTSSCKSAQSGRLTKLRARAASGALQAFASGDASGGEESGAAWEREPAEPVAAWLAALLSWRHPAAPLPPAAVVAWAASAPCATLLKVCAQTCRPRV